MAATTEAPEPQFPAPTGTSEPPVVEDVLLSPPTVSGAAVGACHLVEHGITDFELGRHVYLGGPRLPSQHLVWNPAKATFDCNLCERLIWTGEITDEVVESTLLFDANLGPHLTGLTARADREEIARRYSVETSTGSAFANCVALMRGGAGHGVGARRWRLDGDDRSRGCLNECASGACWSACSMRPRRRRSASRRNGRSCSTRTPVEKRCVTVGKRLTPRSDDEAGRSAKFCAGHEGDWRGTETLRADGRGARDEPLRVAVIPQL
ncbi:MAG: hypothetical protein ABR569_07090 [Gaiellaceae bacterium]